MRWRIKTPFRREMLFRKRPTPPKFRLNMERSVEAIDFIASQWPGVTQYYLSKILYFSDRDHLLDWGRPISGDSYFALEHGPVPSRIYNLLKPGSEEAGDWIELFGSRVETKIDGSKVLMFSRGANEFGALSSTDMGYLKDWTSRLRQLSFTAVEDLAHKELAWIEAWDRRQGNSSEMDLRLWVDEQDPDKDLARAQLAETARFSI
jgi:uncharacterized phage-associated protein